MDKKISLSELRVLMCVAACDLVESERYEEGLMGAAADIMGKIEHHVDGTDPMDPEDICTAALLVEAVASLSRK